MNIFATSNDPWQSAMWLDDVRKNKMILESAQMLSTAMRLLDGVDWLPIYKSTHINHPSNKWVRESRSNFDWLLEHYLSLGQQHHKHHKSMDLAPYFKEYLSYGSFPIDNPTQIPNCAANQSVDVCFKHVPDVHEAYKLYLSARWSRDTIRLTWYNGEKPEWYHG